MQPIVQLCEANWPELVCIGKLRNEENGICCIIKDSFKLHLGDLLFESRMALVTRLI
jgi:hypothetical protein